MAMSADPLQWERQREACVPLRSSIRWVLKENPWTFARPVAAGSLLQPAVLPQRLPAVSHLRIGILSRAPDGKVLIFVSIRTIDDY